MKTEAAAKELICPIFAVVAGMRANSPGIKVGQGIIDSGPPAEQRCRASACMFWQEAMPECEWRGLGSFLDGEPEKWDKMLADRAGERAKSEGFNYAGGVLIYGHPVKVGKFIAARGYCGLAAKAETPK